MKVPSLDPSLDPSPDPSPDPYQTRGGLERLA